MTTIEAKDSFDIIMSGSFGSEDDDDVSAASSTFRARGRHVAEFRSDDWDIENHPWRVQVPVQQQKQQQQQHGGDSTGRDAPKLVGTADAASAAAIMSGGFGGSGYVSPSSSGSSTSGADDSTDESPSPTKRRGRSKSKRKRSHRRRRRHDQEEDVPMAMQRGRSKSCHPTKVRRQQQQHYPLNGDTPSEKILASFVCCADMTLNFFENQCGIEEEMQTIRDDVAWCGKMFC